MANRTSATCSLIPGLRSTGTISKQRHRQAKQREASKGHLLTSSTVTTQEPPNVRVNRAGRIVSSIQVPRMRDEPIPLRLNDVFGGAILPQTIPLLPQAVVVEQPQEDAAHDRARLKACLRRVVRPVPVAHRHPMRRRVQEIENRRDERLEVCARSRERRGPRDPVELRIQPPIVERETVAALHSAIEGHFSLRDGGGEEDRKSVV